MKKIFYLGGYGCPPYYSSKIIAYLPTSSLPPARDRGDVDSSVLNPDEGSQAMDVDANPANGAHSMMTCPSRPTEAAKPCEPSSGIETDCGFVDASLTETSRPEVAASRKRVAPSSGSGAADTAIAAYGFGRKQARENPASPSLASEDPLIAAGGRDESEAALAKLIEMNFYDALGAQPCATNAEIRRAFKAVALKHHQDKGGDPQIFHYLSTVRDILLNKAKRELIRLPWAGAFRGGIFEEAA